MSTSPKIDTFDFSPGRKLTPKYEIVRLLGTGWESEVYLIREVSTGIERAAKLFFPERNPANRVARKTAEKLHALRDCKALIQYVAQDSITFRRQPITMLISEYVAGDLLSDFIAKQPGKRLHPFEALHLLYALAEALEPIHEHGEYHGDLHWGNVIVRRVGIGFDIKLIDIYHREQRKAWNVQEDVFEMIRIFYDVLGGSRLYARQPKQVKDICRGLKRTLIAAKFRNAGQLKRHLEILTWE